MEDERTPWFGFSAMKVISVFFSVESEQTTAHRMDRIQFGPLRARHRTLDANGIQPVSKILRLRV